MENIHKFVCFFVKKKKKLAAEAMNDKLSLHSPDNTQKFDTQDPSETG